MGYKGTTIHKLPPHNEVSTQCKLLVFFQMQGLLWPDLTFVVPNRHMFYANRYFHFQLSLNRVHRWNSGEKKSCYQLFSFTSCTKHQGKNKYMIRIQFHFLLFIIALILSVELVIRVMKAEHCFISRVLVNLLIRYILLCTQNPNITGFW